MSEANIEFYGKFCIEVSPIPNFIVIFGASGDLAHRKLLPALYSLYRRQLFHEESRVIGCGRTEMDDQSFRDSLRDTLEKGEKRDQFLSKVHYVSGDYGEASTYQKLEKEISEVEKEVSVVSGRLYYLSVPERMHERIIKRLGEAGMVEENFEGIPWRNVIIEKPFGWDLASAKKLDRSIHEVLRERQIYRIDHYLGKETVQNILMLRFANAIFEPLWSNRFIEHVQITVAESVGVEHRGGYYDKAGLLRDMFQNHMLEMLSLVTIEPPPSFEANCLRDEKVKLLRSIRPFPKGRLEDCVVRGQYQAGELEGRQVPAYREEEKVDRNSNTETYVAARLFIDNWRWQGVPFYLRSGKRLPSKHSQINIVFKNVPHSIFSPLRPTDLTKNVLTLNVQPEEGVKLHIMAKQPGPKLCMGNLNLGFKYSDIYQAPPSDAYERLLLDAMLGDQTLFIRNDTIELSWSLLTPVLEAWENDAAGAGGLMPYPAGAWGPEAADELLRRDGRGWINPGV